MNEIELKAAYDALSALDRVDFYKSLVNTDWDKLHSVMTQDERDELYLSIHTASEVVDDGTYTVADDGSYDVPVIKYSGHLMSKATVTKGLPLSNVLETHDDRFTSDEQISLLVASVMTKDRDITGQFTRATPQNKGLIIAALRKAEAGGGAPNQPTPPNTAGGK